MSHSNFKPCLTCICIHIYVYTFTYVYPYICTDIYMSIQSTSLFQRWKGKAHMNWNPILSYTLYTEKYNAFYFFIFIILFYFIFKLYITVLVLTNIKMNPPQVYMCSPSWTLLPPPSPFHPSGSSPCTSPKHPVSCIFKLHKDDKAMTPGSVLFSLRYYV